SLLSELTRRDGVRTRRGSLLQALRTSPAVEATEESLAASLAWAFPLVPAEVIREETAALLSEGEVLGVLDSGALTVLGQELVLALDEEITVADARLAAVLEQAAPPPVAEGLLDADRTAVGPGRPAASLPPVLDRPGARPVAEGRLGAHLTAVVPGRPAESLLPLLDWTEPVSRGGALTLRFTTASVRRALGDGRDGEALLALLETVSRTPVP